MTEPPLMMASLPEPPKDASFGNLRPSFSSRLLVLLEALKGAGIPFEMSEGKRSVERQAWLYASGRSRPGHKLTEKDGTLKVGEHQKGLAADIYPLDADGRIYIPDARNSIWFAMARRARILGLRCGIEWGDCPHVELNPAI